MQDSMPCLFLYAFSFSAGEAQKLIYASRFSGPSPHKRKTGTQEQLLRVPVAGHFFRSRQAPDIAQLAQLQPQEVFPFFLSFTIFTIMAATAAARRRHKRIVTRL